MPLIEDLQHIVGAGHVLTGADAAPYGTDWMDLYPSTPLCVVRPASTAEVAAVLRYTYGAGVPVVPVGGNTGLTGATKAEGQVMLSLERLNRVREIRPETRIAIAEAGVVLDRLHEAAEAHGLLFPLYFGARGSAMVGGVLATNAGGSNVVRYGNTRALCLGIEAVLPDGRVMNLLSELYKDNSGYDLRDLLIGAEGTLGVITAAVFRLYPQPLAHATALVALDGVAPARELLNRLQDASGGAVEAFDFMADNYLRRLASKRPELAAPFDPLPPVAVLVEIATSDAKMATPGPDGVSPLAHTLTDVLAEMSGTGHVRDAVIASSEAQRRQLWTMREIAAELISGGLNKLDNDICLPLHLVGTFLERAEPALAAIDPGITRFVVGHLGDGNLHYTVFPTSTDEAAHDVLRERIEEIVHDLGGSFSAEHGIGLSKLPSMARRKDKVALEAMRAIKTALDPKNLMNPGKTLPPG